MTVERLFLQLARMSLAAGWLVLVVLALRLLLKKAPRRLVCLLWALVAFRLVCPAQIEWRASLMPRPLRQNRQRLRNRPLRRPPRRISPPF